MDAPDPVARGARGTSATPRTSSCRACCTRRILRSPYRARARRSASTRRRCPTTSSCSRRTTSASLGATAARSRTRPCSRSTGAVRRRPVAAVAAATAARGGRGARADRGRLRGAAGGVRRGRRRCGRARRSSTTLTTISDNAAAYFGMRPQPGTNVCHLFRHPQRRRRARASPRRTWSSRRRSDGGGAARGDGAARLRWRAGTATGSRCGRARRRRSTCARSSPRSSGSREEQRPGRLSADGRLVRRQDVRPPRGDRRRARAQGGPPGDGRAAADRGVGDAQPPSGGDPRAARRARRRDARREARRLLASTPAPTPTAARASRRRSATRRSARTGSRTSRSTRAASTRTCRRTAPSAATARRRRCGRPSGRWTCSPTGSDWIRSSCGCATCCGTATSSAPARTMHDVHFAECLERGGRRDRLARGPAAGRACACCSRGCRRRAGPRSRSRRTTTAATRCAARRPRWARARAARSSLLAARAARRRPRADPLPRPRHRPRPVRHPDDVEPLDLHDGPRARGGRRATCARTAARGVGEVVNEGGLDPDTGQGIASSHWHQGAAAAEVRVDEETGKVEVVRAARRGLRRAGSSTGRARSSRTRAR